MGYTHSHHPFDLTLWTGHFYPSYACKSMVSMLESICEDAAVAGRRDNPFSNFIPALRSGEWADIGCRRDMEDTHVCITDLAKNFGYNLLGWWWSSGMIARWKLDGMGSWISVRLCRQEEGDEQKRGRKREELHVEVYVGWWAAQFVRDQLPRVIVEDADFPLELEKVVTRSFMETDAAFAKSCSLESTLSSGTTALTAMIFGRCRKDHRPCCDNERMRIESLGGFIDDGYLNGQLSVTRALGDWHMNGLKEISGKSGPLSAEPELKLVTLTNEDEFLIIGSDGIWEVFRSQNAVDFARRKLQEHNDVKLCCREIVGEAIKRGAMDNLTVVMVCFHPEPPPHVVVQRPRVRRSISAEGLQNLKFLLEG
ncbi:DNA-binding protein phosphatase 1 [Actinidia rufa]|uniref:DNA-binding protein phosphatase 1 n=1 Tax=Actinidia rufa TaxID=165716 RepID=A0A7J0FMS2_9ERIC|nr:DNA-binding protein phosphatase 1 [Actinidia rufa]